MKKYLYKIQDVLGVNGWLSREVTPPLVGSTRPMETRSHYCLCSTDRRIFKEVVLEKMVPNDVLKCARCWSILSGVKMDIDIEVWMELARRRLSLILHEDRSK